MGRELLQCSLCGSISFCALNWNLAGMLHASVLKWSLLEQKRSAPMDSILLCGVHARGRSVRDNNCYGIGQQACCALSILPSLSMCSA